MRPGRPEWAQLDELIGHVGPVETYCSYTVEFGCSYLAWICCSYFVQFYCFVDCAGANKSCAGLVWVGRGTSKLRRTKLSSNTHSLQPRRQSGRPHAEQLGSSLGAGHFAAGLLQSPHNALA